MNKEQKILLAGLELFVKRGFNATPMSLIAREANVAVGTIYNHFQTKKEIAEAIYKLIHKDFGVVLMKNIKGDSFKEKYEVIWLNLFHYYESNPDAFYFLTLIGLPPLIDTELIDECKQYYEPIRALYLKAIKYKDIKDIDLDLILYLSRVNVDAVLKLKNSGNFTMTQKHIDDAMQAGWDAIKYREN